MSPAERPLNFTLFTMCLGFASSASAAGEDSTDILYERAVSASQQGRHEAAATLFDEVLGHLDPSHPLRALAVYGSARANQRIGTPETACKAAERYQTFIGLPDAEPEKREKAAKGLPELLAICAKKDALAPTPETQSAVSDGAPQYLNSESISEVGAPAHGTGDTRSSPPDRTWAWAATGAAAASLAGGALLLVLADAAIDDGDTAMARFEESGRTSVSARDAVRDADSRVVTYATFGDAMLGLGAVLGGVAIWLWTSDPETSNAWRPSQNRLLWTGTF